MRNDSPPKPRATTRPVVGVSLRPITERVSRVPFEASPPMTVTAGGSIGLRPSRKPAAFMLIPSAKIKTCRRPVIAASSVPISVPMARLLFTSTPSRMTGRTVACRKETVVTTVWASFTAPSAICPPPEA